MAKLNTILIQVCDECLQGEQETVIPYRSECRQQGCFYFLQKPPAFYIAPETYSQITAGTRFFASLEISPNRLREQALSLSGGSNAEDAT